MGILAKFNIISTEPWKPIHAGSRNEPTLTEPLYPIYPAPKIGPTLAQNPQKCRLSPRLDQPWANFSIHCTPYPGLGQHWPKFLNQNIYIYIYRITQHANTGPMLYSNLASTLCPGCLNLGHPWLSIGPNPGFLTEKSRKSKVGCQPWRSLVYQTCTHKIVFVQLFKQ